jgi:uncharacterized membrane protein YfcA
MNDTGPVSTPSKGIPGTGRQDPMFYWKAYVVTFLAAWAIVAFEFHHLAEILEHWRMSLVMILGSLVAGSTPMGGGTVAFPILVLVFHSAPSNARNFGLIIQALGMTSALIFLICRKVPLPFNLLAGSSAGSAAGFLIGNFLIAPHVQGSLVKLMFACLWMSFGLLTLSRNIEICGLKGKGPSADMATTLTGLAAGLIGGTLASIIGVGVEMCVYALMVLVYRADLRIAIPTAVSAAALASICGAALHLWIGDIDRQAAMNWLAAGPIVIFGAPIGTWLGSKLPRFKVLYFVSGLCIFQFLWTLQQTAHGPTEWIFVAVAMTIGMLLLFTLYKTGKRREKLKVVTPVPTEVLQ